MSHGHNNAMFHPSAAVATVTASGTSILDKGHRQRAPALPAAGALPAPATTGALAGGFLPSTLFRGGAGRGPQLQGLSGQLASAPAPAPALPGMMPAPPAQGGGYGGEYGHGGPIKYGV